MTGRRRIQFALLFLSLLMLRLVVGWHFYREGFTKLDDGNFSSGPFLTSARGPLATAFGWLADDPAGCWRLCIVPADSSPTAASSSGPFVPRFTLDPSVTFAVWDDFVQMAADHYGFSEPAFELLAAARDGDRRAGNEPEQTLPASGSPPDPTITAPGEPLSAVRNQKQRAAAILKQCKDRLQTFFEENRDPILAWAHGADRLSGFVQDGPSRRQAAAQVPALTDQVETIARQRQAEAEVWFAYVESLWDNLEIRINELAIESQRARGPVRLHRPYRQPHSPQAWIDRVVPWFDAVIGGLLLVGLFTRWAAAAGGLFLASIIASQPPWIPGAMPTGYQILECAALGVLFATAAGRYGDLDFFLSRPSARQQRASP